MYRRTWTWPRQHADSDTTNTVRYTYMNGYTVTYTYECRYVNRCAKTERAGAVAHNAPQFTSALDVIAAQRQQANKFSAYVSHLEQLSPAVLRLPRPFYVYIYTYVPVRMCVRTYVRTCVRACVRACVHVVVATYTRTHVNVSYTTRPPGYLKQQSGADWRLWGEGEEGNKIIGVMKGLHGSRICLNACKTLPPVYLAASFHARAIIAIMKYCVFDAATSTRRQKVGIAVQRKKKT